MSIVNAQFQDWKGNVYHIETSADMIKGANETFAPLEHNHDERYYTKAKIDEMAENLKEYVVNGKEKIANAINDKKNDNQMNKDNTFDELANGIRSIETGCPINGIIKRYKVKQGETIKAGDFINFVNGETESFNKNTTQLIADDCDFIGAVQYNENVILLAWYTQKNNVDYIYICDLKVNGENILKGEDKLIFSIDKTSGKNENGEEVKSGINEIHTFDKVGYSDKVVLIYKVDSRIGSQSLEEEGTHCTEIFYNGSISLKDYNLETTINGKAISHITNFFNHNDMFFMISKISYSYYVNFFRIKDNKLFHVMYSYIHLPEKQYDCMGIKMSGDCAVSLIFRESHTSNYVYCRISANYTLLTSVSPGAVQDTISLILPETDYVFLANSVLGTEEVIIYGNKQLKAKFIRPHNKIDSEKVIDYNSQITHNKIYKVFDTGIYINTNYNHTNVGNVIMLYNDSGKNYFASLSSSTSGNLIEESEISDYISNTLASETYLLDYSISKNTSNRIFIMNNNNLLVVNLLDTYGSPIKIETILDLSKMRLNFEENKAKIFYINNRYIVINSNQNTEAFLFDSDLTTGIIKGNTSELEVYNATYEELFAGVAKTSGNSGQYIDAYVSKCRQ